MEVVLKDVDKTLIDTHRRFGAFGPVYRIVSVHEVEGRWMVDVELPESGEKVALPLEHVLSDPLAE